jgi:hypothetical protein
MNHSGARIKFSLDNVSFGYLLSLLQLDIPH